METTTNKNLNAALFKFQGMVDQLPKDGMNPHFKRKYPTLTGLMETIKEPLMECGLLVRSRIDAGKVITDIVHTESGEYISSAMEIQTGGTPQMVGSCITYFRRYSLVAMLNLTTEDDDDGNAASQKQQPQQTPATTPAPIPPAQAIPVQNTTVQKAPFEPSMCDTRLFGQMQAAAAKKAAQGKPFDPAAYLNYFFEINPQQIAWVIAEYDKYLTAPKQ